MATFFGYFGSHSILLLFSKELTSDNYFISDVECGSKYISVDGYSIEFKFKACSLIQGLNESTPIKIKHVGSEHYSLLTELDIGGEKIIDSSYSSKYYYGNILVGFLWCSLSGFFILISLICIRHFIYLSKRMF